MAGDNLSELYDKPGFLLRRALQKSTSVFAAKVGDITTTQFGALYILARNEGLDQSELANLLFIDQTNMGVVIKSLEKNGFLKRSVSITDKRRKILVLTESGALACSTLESKAKLAQSALLENLNVDEQAKLIELLKKL